jgi:hypothetical protein
VYSSRRSKLGKPNPAKLTMREKAMTRKSQITEWIVGIHVAVYSGLNSQRASFGLGGVGRFTGGWVGGGAKEEEREGKRVCQI